MTISLLFRFIPLIICSGGEFKNASIRKLLSNLKIRLIFSESQFKAMYIEVLQRTLERLIYTFLTEDETLRYIHVLQHLVRRYNQTPHSFVKFSPFDIESDVKTHNEVLLRFAKRYDKLKRKSVLFEPGDCVRILLHKSKFHRSYNIQRSYERFKVIKVIPHKIPLYKLADEHGDEIVGKFAAFELVKVKLDTYRSRIIDKKTIRGVKWIKLTFKGYDKSFDLWQKEDESALTTISKYT